jgi:ribosomal protein L40E/flagellar basal body-associated protein FliL
MARKKLGNVELQWTCPNCDAINPGTEKVCLSCGAPQPEDVVFEQAAHQELIQDEEVAKKAARGPDIHCPYCGARNPADAEVCSQCGGDISEGARRKAGQVVGAFETSPVKMIKCPHCGAENPDTAKMCSQCGASLHVEEPEAQQPAAPAGSKSKLGFVLIAVFLVLCAAAAMFAVFAMRTKDIKGTVTAVGWERSVPVIALLPMKYENWHDQIPQDAAIENCRQEERRVVEEPVPNATEECGTPYTVDTGTGYGEVVQDCVYHVYDDYCTYSVNEWQVVDTATVSGTDFAPYWPQPSLEAGQQLGEERTETYQILFDAGDEDYTYKTSDYSLFQECQIGTTWTLNVNSFGTVVSIEQ